MRHSFPIFLSNDPLPFLFSDFATDVLTIPSSEVEDERVFASLSLITTNDMCNILPITLNTRIIIKYNTYFFKEGNNESDAEMKENNSDRSSYKLLTMMVSKSKQRLLLHRHEKHLQ